MRRTLALLGLLALAAGCATTDVRSSWVSDQRPSGMGKTLVIGLSDRPAWARTFEDRMTTELRNTGVQAVPLSTIESRGLREIDDPRVALAEIEQLAMREGFDSVMIGHLLGARKDVEYVSPSPYMGLEPYWSSTWGTYGYGLGYGGTGYGPTSYGAYPTQDISWRMETRLFDTRGERRPLFSLTMSSEGEPTQAVPELVTESMNRLHDTGLLGGRGQRVSLRSGPVE